MPLLGIGLQDARRCSGLGTTVPATRLISATSNPVVPPPLPRTPCRRLRRPPVHGEPSRSCNRRLLPSISQVPQRRSGTCPSISHFRASSYSAYWRPNRRFGPRPPLNRPLVDRCRPLPNLIELTRADDCGLGSGLARMRNVQTPEVLERAICLTQGRLLFYFQVLDGRSFVPPFLSFTCSTKTASLGAGAPER